MDPINYQIDVQNPFQAGLQGYQQGLAINAMQQQAQAAEAQRQAQLKLQQDMYKLATKPDLTSDDIARFTLQNPQLSEQYARSTKMLDESQKQTALKQGMSVFGPLLAGKKELAISSVDELIKANENSGNVDEVTKLKSMKQLIETNDKAAMVSMAPQLAAIMGPEKFAENIKTLGGEPLEEKLHPAEIAKQEAELKLKQAELKQKAVSMGLTNAQINETLARTNNLDIEGQLKRLELKGVQSGKPVSGKPPTEDEKKSAGYAIRIQNNLNLINGIVKKNPKAAQASQIRTALGVIPILGKAVASTDRQRIEAAQLDMLDAALTLNTGAAYTKEQLTSLRESYFPTPLDAPETIKDKENRVQDLINTAMTRAGVAAPMAEKLMTKPQQETTTLPQGWSVTVR